MASGVTVTVVIPARDRAALLPRAVQSALSQVDAEIEVVVADDHSGDNSVAMVKAMAAQEPRVRCVHVTHGEGAQAARNTGIQSAEGEYVAFLDSDDEWDAHLVSESVTCMERQHTVVCYAEGRILNEVTGQKDDRTGVADLRHDAYRTLLSRPPGPIFSSLVVRREHLVRLGPLDEKLVAFQEWDTCLRLARLCGSFGFVDQPLYTWHRHGRSCISADGARNMTGYAQVLAKHRGEIAKQMGWSAVAAHYSVLAQLTGALGRRREQRQYWRRTLLAAIGEPSYLHRALLHVAMCVAGLRPTPLNDRIRVYG